MELSREEYTIPLGVFPVAGRVSEGAREGAREAVESPEWRKTGPELAAPVLSFARQIGDKAVDWRMLCQRVPLVVRVGTSYLEIKMIDR